MKNPNFNEKTRITVIGVNGGTLYDNREFPTNPFNPPDCISLWTEENELVVIPMSRIAKIRFTDIAPKV